ncbi:MAG: hypothetical protein HY075_00200 [Deltaproteobacteria bacterium]|nr:hypothetical protein [Deltaproteobacteria bacterium]
MTEIRQELETRLRTLIDASSRAKQAETASPFVDKVPALAADKREAWSAFLCSIATTESIETMIIEPIRRAFSWSPFVLEYLQAHGDDERRHYELLSGYVKRTFDYEKRRKSLSDVVVYGTLLPGFARVGHRKPLYLLAALRFYEAFSLDFYKILKTLATTDGLHSLVVLIQTIEKDELRHLAGLDALVRAHCEEHGPPSAADLLGIRSLLNLLLFDINIAPWAVYNRRVRRNALAIGVEPARMNRDARAAAEDAVRFVAGKKGL